MSSLAGLDLSSPGAYTAPIEPDVVSAPAPTPVPQSTSSPAHVSKAVTSSANPTGRKMSTPLTHGADKWLTRHIYNHEVCLFVRP